jgi:hypothetical protein
MIISTEITAKARKYKILLPLIKKEIIYTINKVDYNLANTKEDFANRR